MYLGDVWSKYITEMWFLNNINIIKKYHSNMLYMYEYLDALLLNIQTHYDIMKNYDKKMFYIGLKNL